MPSEIVSSSALLPIVIVVLVVFMIVGPIMMMRPSQRQQFLAKLRQEAMDQQLQVSQAVWPKRLTAPLGLMRYGLRQPRLPSHMGAALWVRENYAHSLHLAEYWHRCDEAIGSSSSVDEQRQKSLARVLSEWNQDTVIKAVGFANGCVFVDWVESSQISLEEIKVRLLKAVEALNSAP